MQLYHLLQVVFIAGTISARNDPRQVIVTVTAGVEPSSAGAPTAPSPIPLSAPPVPWEQTSAAAVSASVTAAIPVPTSSGNLSLPPSLTPPKTVSPTSALGGPGPSGGAKCGKGYTYCGYMLTGVGHNFAPADIEKSYCNGLPELCSGGKRKTNADQAVFVCMEDQPSTVQLVCACSGTCLNNSTTNYIAHCDKPCVNN
ncbi:hypothetical protein E0Z10_g7646 [Xylaria hypoxylon]|uniref:WSC domain-containing protein n=1 Tax=Xylaria hypoxylon TaxID=37992 RepID=A0A4Z0YB25_9PEZI|nr:hypothetical protein E0Z10_g7646 [Xylaria hypoxylon]